MRLRFRRIMAKIAILRHFSYFSEYRRLINVINNFENKDGELPINNLIVWKRKIRSVSKYGKTFFDIGCLFFTTHIFPEKLINTSNNEITLICIIKNDIERIRLFLEYYRSIGIKHFAFLDDKSTDGTKEYLLKQKDVDVFGSYESYSTNRRQAWINRLISFYGLDKWFLVVDSDEFLSIRQNSIEELVMLLDKKTKCRCLMVDMYPVEDNQSGNFVNRCRGFDKDTYSLTNDSLWFNCVRGGMRRRIFSNGTNKINPYLVKTPLFKADKKIVQINSHFNYPFSYDKDFIGILRHYKFLKDDLVKYTERVKNRNFSNGSEEYLAYADKFSNDSAFNFNYEGSEVFENYDSFYKIGIYHKNKFN